MSSSAPSPMPSPTLSDIGERQELDSLRTLLGETNVAVYVAQDGKICDPNRAALDMYGYPEKILTGHHFTKFIHPDDRELVQSRHVRRLQGEELPTTYEFRIINADGEVRHVELNVVPSEWNGRPATFCVQTDITERYQALAALKIALRKAEDANRAKSDFLASISHELRTPLNAIMGYSEMLLNEMFGPVGSEKNKEYLGDIHAAGAHLRGLINEILDLSRIEAGKVKINAQATDIQSISAECLEMVRVLASEKQISTGRDIPANLPAIRVDAQHLTQILVNVLSNAIKFTPEGGSIRLWADADSGRAVRIAVSDTGVGIPTSALKTVTEAFERLGDAYTRDQEGTGLGLPLAKRLTEINGGTLSIDSTVGEGTTVTLRFPSVVPSVP